MQSTTQTVEIRFKPRISMFDRPLQRALVYSLLFHGCLFGVFRIKCFELNEQAATFQPVEVAIEGEETKEEKSLVSVIEPLSEEKIKAPIDKNMVQFLQEAPPFDDLISKSLFSKNEPQSQIFEESIPSDLLSEQLEFQEPLYPLKLQLSKTLSRLKLIEDGSSLFKAKEVGSHQGVLATATLTYPIEYSVKISGKTGSVIEWKRKRELIDKTLQTHADKLIQELRFAPLESASLDSKIRGKVVMIFECPGDELAKMVR